MWISKHVWAQLGDLVATQRDEIKSLRDQLSQRDRLVADRDAHLAAQGRELVTQAHALGQQKERHSTLQFKLELLMARLNQVQTERDQFLTKIVPELKISTPHIGYEPVLAPPGATFEDMGDAAAAVHGIDAPAGESEPLDPDALEFGGLAGEVVNKQTVKT
jgi:hypothetical protein